MFRGPFMRLHAAATFPRLCQLRKALPSYFSSTVHLTHERAHKTTQRTPRQQHELKLTNAHSSRVPHTTRTQAK